MPFDCDGKRPDPLLPPGGKLAGAIVLLLKAGRQIPRLIVVVDEPEMFLAEARIAIAAMTCPVGPFVKVAALPVRVAMTVMIPCSSTAGAQQR